MSRAVASLVRAGYAARAPDPRDGRSSIVRATEAGRRILHRGRRRRVALLARRFAALRPADRALLVRAARLMETVATG